MGTTDSCLRQISTLTYLNICVYCTYVMFIKRRQRVDTTKRINRTAERLAKTSADSYKMVVDHVVAQQERNVRFARGLLDDTARELRHQAESNQSVVGEFVERAEEAPGVMEAKLEITRRDCIEPHSGHSAGSSASLIGRIRSKRSSQPAHLYS